MIVLFDNYDYDIEELGDYEGFWFEDAMHTIEKAIPEAFIVKGKVGRWNGDCSGCEIYAGTFREAFDKLMDDCDYIQMYIDDDGVFNLEGYHHDGHNHFVIKNLTKEGLKNTKIGVIIGTTQRVNLRLRTTCLRIIQRI